MLPAGKAGEMAGEVEQRNSVEVYGLQKRYAGSRGFCWTGCSLNCCSACDACSCKVGARDATQPQPQAARLMCLPAM